MTGVLSIGNNWWVWFWAQFITYWAPLGGAFASRKVAEECVILSILQVMLILVLCAVALIYWYVFLLSCTWYRQDNLRPSHYWCDFVMFLFVFDVLVGDDARKQNWVWWRGSWSTTSCNLAVAERMAECVVPTADRVSSRFLSNFIPYWEWAHVQHFTFLVIDGTSWTVISRLVLSDTHYKIIKHSNPSYLHTCKDIFFIGQSN